MRPDEIATALRQAFRERLIPPGQALNQDELARRFGVSRIPLREALRTLVGEGLIIMRPGLGAVVTELNVDEVEELYGLRLQLEPPLAPGIVERLGQRDVDDLARLVEGMRALTAAQSEEWSTLNYRFHRRLYELSGQRHAVRLVTQVLNLVEPYARVHAHVLGSRPRMQQERVDMLQAVRDHEAERVEELIDRSIRAARTELAQAMAEISIN
ncbi:GntR family transcriptional regulator [Paractinoplanes globisporus]|jgi:DNA-binding GntR family transcriptional regulator|uniref:GntR family transcriptional regulator n=1 Tax=Paractinoplanes globisporus TaxID=113565 RepID=A0ABW6WDU7_9ACTN|nr:GntR family transcriptional regulator [Actinoplanes globisporus]